MLNPIISNAALVSRFPELALASQCVIDGATISYDGVFLRGTILSRPTVGGKWQKFTGGLVSLGNIRILKDDQKVEAGKDAFAAGHFRGFFAMAALLDVNPALLAGDFSAALGFQQLEADEIELK